MLPFITHQESATAFPRLQQKALVFHPHPALVWFIQFHPSQALHFPPRRRLIGMLRGHANLHHMPLLSQISNEAEVVKPVLQSLAQVKGSSEKRVLQKSTFMQSNYTPLDSQFNLLLL